MLQQEVLLHFVSLSLSFGPKWRRNQRKNEGQRPYDKQQDKTWQYNRSDYKDKDEWKYKMAYIAFVYSFVKFGYISISSANKGHTWVSWPFSTYKF